MKNKKVNFQSRLIQVQVILILPLLILSIISSFYILYLTAYQKTEITARYQLNNFSNSFQVVIDNTLKLLEKPYTNMELYRILSGTYTDNEVELYRDDRQVLSILYNDIMFYNPYISAVIISANNRTTPYLKYASPFLLNPNYDLNEIKQSEWYKEAMTKTSYFISNVHFDSMFISKERVISIVQQISEPLSRKTLGVIKLNLNFDEIVKTFPNQLLGNMDKFYVTDSNNNVVYTNVDSTVNSGFMYETISIQNNSTRLNFNYVISKQSIFEQMMLPYTLILISILSIFFGCIIYINKMSKSISKPIVLLKNSMIEAQNGNLSIRSNHLEGEMDVLANSFNELMNKIEELIHDIRKQEQEKSSLQYELLQSKINPHFIYNSLNALKWKSQSIGATDLSQAIDSLAIFLKKIIKTKGSMISIGEELSLVENYIAIMQTRYDNDIEINYDLDTFLFAFECPKLILQPIVENCFIHAFTEKNLNKQIDIKLYREGDSIVLEIKDNGIGIDENIVQGQAATSGLGIHAVNQRLKKIYGDEYGITIKSLLNEETTVSVKIPMNQEGDNENIISG